MGHEKKICDEVESVRLITYLGYKVSIGGGCVAAVIAGTVIKWGKLTELGNLLHVRDFL